jgi:hypothetical protein
MAKKGSAAQKAARANFAKKFGGKASAKGGSKKDGSKKGKGKK